MKKVIGIVGMPGAGKSTAIKIGSDFGEIIVMGNIVREETKLRGLDITSQNLGKIAKKLREEEGNDVIAQRCIKKITQSSNNFLILDGIRSMHEVKLFQKKIHLEIIAIEVPDNIRHDWLKNRGRADDSISIEKILARDKREIEFGIRDVIKNADFSIDNIGDIEELRNKCKNTFELIINDKT